MAPGAGDGRAMAPPVPPEQNSANGRAGNSHFIIILLFFMYFNVNFYLKNIKNFEKQRKTEENMGKHGKTFLLPPRILF